MKKPVRVAVTGPAGNIGYALLFRIAAGDMLGPDQPVILQLLERNTPESAARLKGVMMELADCAFPLLADMMSTADPMVAFKDADAAILVGARPRTKGMERSELLSANGAIFTEQGARRCRQPRRQGSCGGQPLQHQRIHRHEIGSVTLAQVLLRNAAFGPQPRPLATFRHHRQTRDNHAQDGRLGQPRALDVSGHPLLHD